VILGLQRRPGDRHRPSNTSHAGGRTLPDPRVDPGGRPAAVPDSGFSPRLRRSRTDLLDGTIGCDPPAGPPPDPTGSL